jgi:hypothetical protein
MDMSLRILSKALETKAKTDEKAKLGCVDHKKKIKSSKCFLKKI